MSRVFTTIVAYREGESGPVDPCLLEPIAGIGQWGGGSPNDGRIARRSNRMSRGFCSTARTPRLSTSWR